MALPDGQTITRARPALTSSRETGDGLRSRGIPGRHRTKPLSGALAIPSGIAPLLQGREPALLDDAFASLKCSEVGAAPMFRIIGFQCGLRPPTRRGVRGSVAGWLHRRPPHR